MKRKNLLFLLIICLAFVFALTACTGSKPGGGQSQEPERIYWGTLTGTVTENGSGLSGVTVTSGEETTITDENGNYSVAVYDNGATVVFEKEGCITQKKTFKSSSFYADTITYDFIMFISTRVSGTVTDAEGNAVANAVVTIGLQQMITDEGGMFAFESVIGTSMILTVTYNNKTARRPLYTEEMRTGAVTVTMILA